MMFTSAQTWHDDVLAVADSRFERRMAEELTKLRVELAAMRVENLRWSFVFWLSQLGALAGMLKYFM